MVPPRTSDAVLVVCVAREPDAVGQRAAEDN